MECPECGGSLTSRGARIEQPMPFRTDPKYKKGHIYTKYRRIYECATCGKAFIQTIVLKEVKVVGN